MFVCEKDEHCIDCPKNYPYEKCEHWIEVEPVKHGHWETLLIGNIQCSQCWHEPYWDSDDWKLNCGNPYYCPNCGAKMDEEVDT